MFAVGLLLLSSLLEVERVSDLEPAAGKELIDLIRSELRRATGCEFELRDCEIVDCGASTGPAGAPGVRLSIIGGVRRISVSMGRSDSARRREVFWPFEASEWPRLARELLADEPLGSMCAHEPGALNSPSATHESAVNGLTIGLLATSGLAVVGAAIALVAAQPSIDAIHALGDFDPSLDDLRQDVTIKRSVSVSLIGAAVGALILAGLNEL